MTKVTIDRELLERVAQYTPSIDRQEDRARAISELRSVLDSAPRQPEGDAASILLPALRQYMHNDGSGLLAGYEYERTQQIVAELRQECERLRAEVENKYREPSKNELALEAERDTLRAELEAIKGQEPVAFYWQDIGYPDPRTHGPHFGRPSESALRNVDGRAIPVLLYTLPPASPDQEGT